MKKLPVMLIENVPSLFRQVNHRPALEGEWLSFTPREDDGEQRHFYYSEGAWHESATPPPGSFDIAEH